MTPALATAALLLFTAASGQGDPAPHDLARDETRGGHTLGRHVGRTDDQLRTRLRREHHLAAASTYTDRPTAEAVVAAALEQETARVGAWRKRHGPRPNLVLNYQGERVVGRSIVRGQRTPQPCTDAVVVLRWSDTTHDDYVLTSYPEVRP